MNADLIKSLLERKFILSLVAQLASLVLVAMGKVDGEQWSTLNMVILGAFTLGNLSEQFARN